MASWKEAIMGLGHTIETHFDHLRYGLKHKLGYDEPLQIVPYLSFGNQQTITLKGRVLESKQDLDTLDPESTWENLTDSYRRFASDEVPHLVLNLEIANAKASTQTDEEGYFKTTLPTPPLDSQTFWHDVTVSVPAQQSLEKLPQPVVGKVCVPHPDCDIGIVSDIDDTIIVTDATNLLTMARLTFLESPASRLPFAGVAAFYNALKHGGAHERPIFYVSSSPWNLYDFLIDFMRINHIPLGPLFLRDWGLNVAGMKDHKEHKVDGIIQLMKTYPQMSFILMGDSGQKDPEAFSTLVEAHANRIKAIYIRDVSPQEQRDTQVEILAEKAKQHHIDMLLVADSLAAAEHAAAKGFISTEALETVRADMLKQDPAAQQVEQAVTR